MAIWKVGFSDHGFELVEADSMESACSRAVSVVSLELTVEAGEQADIREELLEAKAMLEVVSVKLIAPRVICG